MEAAPPSPSRSRDQGRTDCRTDGRASVEVRTGARLHLGFLDLNGSLGRRYGSIGMMLDGPGTCLTVACARHSVVMGVERVRAGRYLALLQSTLCVPPAHCVHLVSAIPAHAGLGSGTQLAMALGAALRSLHGLAQEPRRDAIRLGRGARSGIGIGLFERGGFAMDGGHGATTEAPPALVHLKVAESWRVLLLRDPTLCGLSGEREARAFRSLPPMADEGADRLCRIAVMQVLPALVEADLAAFGAGVTEMQNRLGAYFAPAQGGSPQASPRVAVALRRLAAAGATGLGQSSWGPTGFAFAGSEVAAVDLAARLRADPETAMLQVSIQRPLNHGAEIGAVEITSEASCGT